VGSSIVKLLQLHQSEPECILYALYSRLKTDVVSGHQSCLSRHSANAVRYQYPLPVFIRGFFSVWTTGCFMV